MADRSEAVANQLVEGVAHLRAGRIAEAAQLLGSVCEDADLRAASDLKDVRARALSLLADAQLQLGRVDAAEAAARESLDLLRGLGDERGVAAVREVWERVQRARQDRAAEERRDASARRLRTTTVEELEHRYGSDPLRLADVLLKKANAEADVRNDALAASVAHRALGLAEGADDVRIGVFARIALARVDKHSAAEHIRAALRRADGANEFNLVSAVAAAAEALDIELPVQVGPDLGRAGDETDDSMS